jgi:hypothetical protein
MGKLRCQTLTAFFALLAVSASGCQQVTETPQNPTPGGDKSMGLIIRNLNPPGAFEVENTGDAIELSWTVGVEQKVGEAWESRVVEELRLVEQCDPPPTTRCRNLDKGVKIRPIPWTGFSHTAQCQTSARANIYLGPGTFRFVVTSCDGSRKYYSEGFTLPAKPQ